MSSYISHRWQYDPLRYGYACVKVPPGGTSEGCPGCGVFVTHEELYAASEGEATDVIQSAMLNTIAMLKEQAHGTG